MHASPVRTAAAMLLSAAAIASVAACAPAPEPGGTTSSGPSGTAAASSFKPCIVAEVGGFDDHAFNELNLQGIEAASKDLGVDYAKAESNGSDQYAGNLSAMVDNGCSVIEAIGFEMANATRDAAQANPDKHYIIVDSTLSDADGNPLTLPNVKPIVFNTAEASYLAGYVAAAASKTGVVGTFGGTQIPPVTAYMDGFAEGVEKYDQAHGATVKVVGWDHAAQNGLFVGDFVSTTKAASLTQSLVDQGADVIMPVAGTLVGATATAVQGTGKNVLLVGVDSDQYVLNPTFKQLFLVSVLKNMQNSTKDVVEAAAKGDFSSDVYTGTLANGGVGISDLHDQASAVPQAVLDEVTGLQQQIASGSLTVTTGK